MKENVIKTKSFAFGLQIVNVYKFLQGEKREYILSKQIMRSGTSVGAMVREAEHAESKADFIHKLAIAQKVANETEYWIELLFQDNYIYEPICKSLFVDLTELRKLLAAIITSTKRNLAKEKR